MVSKGQMIYIAERIFSCHAMIAIHTSVFYLNLKREENKVVPHLLTLCVSHPQLLELVLQGVKWQEELGALMNLSSKLLERKNKA